MAIRNANHLVEDAFPRKDKENRSESWMLYFVRIKSYCWDKNSGLSYLKAIQERGTSMIACQFWLHPPHIANEGDACNREDQEEHVGDKYRNRYSE